MTATTDHTPTTGERVSSPPARLSLAPDDAGPALLDGAWWPYSRDLARELPAMIDVLDRRWGRITRIAVNPTLWPVIPRKVPVAGHVVHVGWFAAAQDPHKLLLLSSTAGRWDLLVIPPVTGEAAAARLMAAATEPQGHLTATALMANEEALSATEADRGGEAEWESEGGTVPGPGNPARLPGSAQGM
ncbi:DUF5994 family protein [Streptomyces sp. 8N616]|uniref:DUF5994 family protein n=1 Tax=Streptomyces sp. 8N616 TaxID=3457414 RepID=UPI003FD408F6